MGARSGRSGLAHAQSGQVVHTPVARWDEDHILAQDGCHRAIVDPHCTASQSDRHSAVVEVQWWGPSNAHLRPKAVVVEADGPRWC